VRSTVTVTVPAVSTALTTLAAITADLGLGADASTHTVQQMIARASRAISGYLGRPLARQTVVETFRDVEGWRMLLLSHAPVASIASVVVDGATLAPSDYELAGDARQLHRLADDLTTDWTAAKIVVTYTGGYILPGQPGATLPPDIEWACIMTVAADWHMRGRDPTLRSETVDGIGGQSWLDPDTAAHGGLPWAAAERLQPYRRFDR